MNILHLVIETFKIQLSDCTEIHKYCGKYKKAYDTVCSFIGPNSDLPIKGVAMLLQAGLFTRIKDKYSSIILTIESKQKKRQTDHAENILKLIYFADIKKKNAKLASKASSNILFTTNLFKPVSHQAPKRLCKN